MLFFFVDVNVRIPSLHLSPRCMYCTSNVCIIFYIFIYLSRIYTGLQTRSLATLKLGPDVRYSFKN